MDDKHLKKLQLAELDILKEIDRLCQKAKIDYFLCAGTLLGAIRHQGFIPWDDDIDIFMTRANYEKFTDICLKELNDKYIIDNYRTNKKCSLTYTKVKRQGTLFIETKNKNDYDGSEGIWVDIFPLDGLKYEKSKFQDFLYKVFNYITTFITIKNGSNYYQNSKIKKKIYAFILKFIPIRFLHFLVFKVVTFYNEDKCAYLVSFSNTYGFHKETFAKEKLLPYQKVTFENQCFMGIKGYDYYLTKVYGDYMKLPPKEKRVNHAPYLIRFEDGEELIFKDGDTK